MRDKSKDSTCNNDEVTIKVISREPYPKSTCTTFTLEGYRLGCCRPPWEGFLFGFVWRKRVLGVAKTFVLRA